MQQVIWDLVEMAVLSVVTVALLWFAMDALVKLLFWG